MEKTWNLAAHLARHGGSEALVAPSGACSYTDLEQKIARWAVRLDAIGIGPGAVAGIKSDFSIDAITLLLAVFRQQAIAALVPSSAPDDSKFIQDGRIAHLFAASAAGLSGNPVPDPSTEDHPLLLGLKKDRRPGFIIFTSGSTGTPKAILHDAGRFLVKFQNATKKFRTLAFLLFDHIAGLDNLFYTLASGGTLIIPPARDPFAVCRTIQDQRVEVLPVSPAFLNLLLVSEAYRQFDLSSLRIITYGSEPMSASTLARTAEIFPSTRIVQKYGTSEFGSPPSKSMGNRELWMKMDSEHFQTRIVDNILWVKATSTMVGYLNAPQPPMEGGWICTGDEVEVRDGWLRILGRKSEMINVGGEKVFPAEVEAVIEQMAEVVEAVVKGEPHPLLGQCVCATVYPSDPHAAPADLRKAIRRHCSGLLPPYKVPTKIVVESHAFTTPRQKKLRR